MAFEHYIYTGTTRLRCGYTTGSCAALAAKAACEMLLSRKPVGLVSIVTPGGLPSRRTWSTHASARGAPSAPFERTQATMPM